MRLVIPTAVTLGLLVTPLLAHGEVVLHAKHQKTKHQVVKVAARMAQSEYKVKNTEEYMSFGDFGNPKQIPLTAFLREPQKPLGVNRPLVHAPLLTLSSDNARHHISTGGESLLVLDVRQSQGK